MQLRFESTLTFEQYVTERAWDQAALQACPLCKPGTCHLQRLAPYMRKIPAVAFVVRYYCPEQHTTVGLLPDFYSSRMPGTLDDLEQAAATAELAPSVEQAAAQLRPADRPAAITLGVVVAGLRRRLVLVRALLVTVMGLWPDRFAGMALWVRAGVARAVGDLARAGGAARDLRPAAVLAAAASRSQSP